MNNKYTTAGYALLLSLLFILGGTYINPIFGLINPWILLPLAPLGYIIAVHKDLSTTMLLVLGIVMFGFIERQLAVNTEAWKFDFQRMGALYFIAPVWVSAYLTYNIVNNLVLRMTKYDETKVIVISIVSIMVISTVVKMILFMATDTIYGGLL